MARRLLHYDLTESPKTVADIIESINEKRYENLDELLKLIEWDLVADELIEPKEIRKFTKRITDEEVRLDVMKFLQKYAKQYFREAAERAEYKEKVDNSVGFSLVTIHIKTPDERVQLIQQELLFLIDQIENKGQYTGDHVAKLNKRIAELEKQNKELTAKNIELETQLDKYKHPRDYGKHIPKELQRDDFINIMNHLTNDGIVRKVIERNDYGIQQVTCYQWDASKALFGYFVEQMNDVLGIKGGRIPLNWKLFEPVINNYDELIKEARKALSTYNNDSSLQKNRIENIEKVDNAIKNKDVNPDLPLKKVNPATMLI